MMTEDHRHDAESTANEDHEQHHIESIGDSLEEDPLEGTIRIYFQNLNGLNWDAQGGKWPYICEVMEGIQVDIACFAEMNTDTNNFDVRRKMEQICQRQHSQSRLVMASSKYRTTTLYKPGGTAILACNAITAHIKSHTRDRMGRWATMSFSLSATKRVRVISAYQVCSNISPGSNTAASQQRAHIMEEQSLQGASHRKTPREAFIQDLQTFILQVQNDGEDIVLVGDFNEDISSPSSGMDSLATTCGLVDLFNIRIGSKAISNVPTRNKKAGLRFTVTNTNRQSQIGRVRSVWIPNSNGPPGNVYRLHQGGFILA